jgi:hypothetical protein
MLVKNVASISLLDDCRGDLGGGGTRGGLLLHVS